MKHLPSIEALTDADDRRLLAELEICEVLEKLARVRALVDRADNLITTVLACGAAPPVDPTERPLAVDPQLCSAILATLRRR